MEYGYKRVINDSFESVEAKAREMLAEQGFGVLTEVNVKNTLKEKLDIDFGKYQILGACNPSLAFEALSSELGVGLFMPCNIVVWENENKSTTVASIDAKTMSDLIQNDQIDALAERVNSLLKIALDAI